MRKIITFDCDGTLNISAGPVPLSALTELQGQSWRVGICGNWQKVKQHLTTLDFYLGAPKDENLKKEGEGFEVKIFVADTTTDEQAARHAGWRFIYAKDFKLEEILKNE